MVDEQTSTNKRRPDYKTDVYESYEFAYTTTFGEIKANKDVSTGDNVVDFHRIAMFCKNAIDNFNLSTTIGFQVVGKTITFLAISLQYKHLYIFTEIVSLEIPLKKSDILNLVGRFDDLATLSYIHDNLCTPSTGDISHLRIETSQYSYVCDSLNQSKTKKHKICLTLGS
ncbi:hypothetical protein CLU79DRAFT_100264 [Phycomyces nitens]|nr:hypothetical protein CLU79DRAFT_100264 [Phycomyces nitens]